MVALKYNLNSSKNPANENSMTSEDSVQNLTSSAKASTAVAGSNLESASPQLSPASVPQSSPVVNSLQQPPTSKGIVAAMSRLYKSSKTRRNLQAGIEIGTDDSSALSKVNILHWYFMFLFIKLTF